jgi:hypothetical protein
VGLEIKFVHFGWLDELFKNGDVFLGVEFIFDGVLAGRDEADGFSGILDISYFLVTHFDSVSNFLYSLLLLLCFLVDSVIDFYK